MSSRGQDRTRPPNADQRSPTSADGEDCGTPITSHGNEPTRKPGSPITEAVPIESVASNTDTRVQLQPGKTINRFELVQQIGEGGMGLAWKAIDPLRQGASNSGFVVLKFLKPNEQGDKAALEQSRAAFQMISKLQHTHICAVHELIEDPNVGCFQVMQYIDGLTLSQYRQKYGDSLGRVSLDRVVEFVKAAAAGLQEAHDHNVLHRDIKPDNMMIENINDRLLLIDFGLAGDMLRNAGQSTGLFAAGGTPAYMAPEQMLSEKQSAATDQYSLAVVVWELLTGNRPFARKATTSQLKAMLNEKLSPADQMSESIRDVLRKALQSDRKERFSSVHQFAIAFAAVASQAEASCSRVEHESLQRSAQGTSPLTVSKAQEQQVLKTAEQSSNKKVSPLQVAIFFIFVTILMVAGAELDSRKGTTPEWKLKLMGSGALRGLIVFLLGILPWRHGHWRSSGAAILSTLCALYAIIPLIEPVNDRVRDGDHLQGSLFFTVFILLLSLPAVFIGWLKPKLPKWLIEWL